MAIPASAARHLPLVTHHSRAGDPAAPSGPPTHVGWSRVEGRVIRSRLLRVQEIEHSEVIDDEGVGELGLLDVAGPVADLGAQLGAGNQDVVSWCKGNDRKYEERVPAPATQLVHQGAGDHEFRLELFELYCLGALPNDFD